MERLDSPEPAQHQTETTPLNKSVGSQVIQDIKDSRRKQII